MRDIVHPIMSSQPPSSSTTNTSSVSASEASPFSSSLPQSLKSVAGGENEVASGAAFAAVTSTTGSTVTVGVSSSSDEEDVNSIDIDRVCVSQETVVRLFESIQEGSQDIVVHTNTGTFTAEAREPDRRKRLFLQLQHARRLCIALETTAASQTSSADALKALLLHKNNICELVSLTEAFFKRYTLDSYHHYTHEIQRRQYKHQQQVDSAKELLVDTLRDWGEEIHPLAAPRTLPPLHQQQQHTITTTNTTNNATILATTTPTAAISHKKKRNKKKKEDTTLHKHKKQRNQRAATYSDNNAGGIQHLSTAGESDAGGGIRHLLLLEPCVAQSTLAETSMNKDGEQRKQVVEEVHAHDEKETIHPSAEALTTSSITQQQYTKSSDTTAALTSRPTSPTCSSSNNTASSARYSRSAENTASSTNNNTPSSSIKMSTHSSKTQQKTSTSITSSSTTTNLSSFMPMRKCHNCKNAVRMYLRCNFFNTNGLKCLKTFCRPCLTSNYNLEDFDDAKDLEHDWFCPSCLGYCNCSTCTKDRERNERKGRATSRMRNSM